MTTYDVVILSLKGLAAGLALFMVLISLLAVLAAVARSGQISRQEEDEETARGLENYLAAKLDEEFETAA